MRRVARYGPYLPAAVRRARQRR